MTTDRLREEFEALRQQVQQLQSGATVGVLRYGQFSGIQIPTFDEYPTNPTTGQLFWYTVTNSPVVWNGSAWVDLYYGQFPLGSIAIWSGSTGSIPTGWQLCNGTNGTPDLRDRFVVGAGTTYAVGATGGSTTQPNHDDHANDGSHDHNDFPHDHTMGGAATGATAGADVILEAAQTNTGVSTDAVPTDGSHNHDAHSAHGTNLPPYYALAFIQRLS